MNTRHGKIARLPLAIREQLNRRLQNGELSPALLPWLNQLPEVNSVLTEFFAGQPISRQNLSEWRQGGYRDWLKCQERELRIRQIAEDGTSLKKQECAEDLFENFARIAVAELSVDMDELAELEGDERWKRLRGLTRELARLQHEYNRSREVELTWEKWNDQFEDEDCEETPQPAAPAPQPQAAAPPPQSIEAVAVKVDQTVSNEGGEPWQQREAEARKIRTYIPRRIHHRRCNSGCICKNCHPDDGPYPYSEALRDQTEALGKGVQAFWRGNVLINITYVNCDCPCDCERNRAEFEDKISGPGNSAQDNQKCASLTHERYLTPETTLVCPASALSPS